MDPLNQLIAQNPLFQELNWIEILELVLIALAFWLVLEVHGSRKLLKSIDQSLKALPAVQNQRKSA